MVTMKIRLSHLTSFLMILLWLQYLHNNKNDLTDQCLGKLKLQDFWKMYIPNLKYLKRIMFTQSYIVQIGVKFQNCVELIVKNDRKYG